MDEYAKEASDVTIRANREVRDSLDFDNVSQVGGINAIADATRGFVATWQDLIVNTADGQEVWSLRAYDFLEQPEAPPSVNPSLWRHARLNMNNGLFEVIADGIYQVRGFDLSNMTIVEGNNGIIIIDPLISTEVARAALDLYYENRPWKPVEAVIYTHSHIDHFGGASGILSDEDIARGVKVIAPQGFLEAAVSENVMAGFAMSRRSEYMFAPYLPRGEKGQVDAGLGKSRSVGMLSLVPPTDVITSTGQTMSIAGIEMVFQLTPDTEAPTEMTIYFPQFRVFNSAELATDTTHNVLTPRGAQVRDANAWAYFLNEAIALYGDKTDVVIAQHHWPKWGQETVVAFLKAQRDMYKYVHDQTLRLMNLGYTGIEIAEMLKPPEHLNQQWFLRGYYGTHNFNIKAIYQKYLGWFDANPANMLPLPPEQSARKLVEYMGSPDEILAKAREDFDNGEYRWVAEVLNTLVFADPQNEEAKHLQADALEQLGYQAESAVTRNFYLTGAYELRHGVQSSPAAGTPADLVSQMTIPMIFDFLGVCLNGPKADGLRLVINWIFTDLDQRYVLNLENSALTYLQSPPAMLSPDADVSLTLTRDSFNQVLFGMMTLEQAIESGGVQVEGDPQQLGKLMGLLDTFGTPFNIVTP
jgi:alkyl sulfatase BDS1-like metallo-beta-lactamase superfamily hydrolase